MNSALLARGGKVFSPPPPPPLPPTPNSKGKNALTPQHPTLPLCPGRSSADLAPQPLKQQTLP